MRRQKPKRTLCKGGGGGGSTARLAVSTTRKASRTVANKVDKSTWNSPPGTPVDFYNGKRVHGKVNQFGGVSWTIDDSHDKISGKIPTQELKNLKRAWGEYLKSPNANRVFIGSILYGDGAGEAREKMYKSLGFKGKREGNGAILKFDNTHD